MVEGKLGESEGLENEKKLEYTLKILVYSGYFLFSAHSIKRNINICQYKDNNDLTILYKKKKVKENKTHLLIFFFHSPKYVMPSQIIFSHSISNLIFFKFGNAYKGQERACWALAYIILA